MLHAAWMYRTGKTYRYFLNPLNAFCLIIFLVNALRTLVSYKFSMFLTMYNSRHTPHRNGSSAIVPLHFRNILPHTRI